MNSMTCARNAVAFEIEDRAVGALEAVFEGGKRRAVSSAAPPGRVR